MNDLVMFYFVWLFLLIRAQSLIISYVMTLLSKREFKEKK